MKWGSGDHDHAPHIYLYLSYLFFNDFLNSVDHFKRDWKEKDKSISEQETKIKARQDSAVGCSTWQYLANQ